MSSVSSPCRLSEAGMDQVAEAIAATPGTLFVPTADRVKELIRTGVLQLVVTKTDAPTSTVSLPGMLYSSFNRRDETMYVPVDTNLILQD